MIAGCKIALGASVFIINVQVTTRRSQAIQFWGYKIQNIWVFLVFDWDEVFKKHFKLLEHSDFHILYGGEGRGVSPFPFVPLNAVYKKLTLR